MFNTIKSFINSERANELFFALNMGYLALLIVLFCTCLYPNLSYDIMMSGICYLMFLAWPAAYIVGIAIWLIYIGVKGIISHFTRSPQPKEEITWTYIPNNPVVEGSVSYPSTAFSEESWLL